MAENHHPSEEEPVCKTWSRLIEVVLGLFLLVGTGFMAHYYAPPSELPPPLPKNPTTDSDRKRAEQQLQRQRAELQQNELRQLTR